MTDEHSAEEKAPATPQKLSRRGLLGLAGAGVVGMGVGVVGDRGVLAAADSMSTSGSTTSNTSYPFHGTHQSGIVTPAQDRLHFAAFDMSSTASRADLIELLQDWSAAAALMCQGKPVGEFGAVDGPYDAPPEDTGEALDLPTGGLTITFGFGPSLFVDASGADRFGIAAQQPAELRELPHFPADDLDPQRTGGDLCIQACSDDPQIAVHAIRNLSRIAFGRASLRWSQLGFGRTSSTSTSQVTPRNLFGFKDGTANIKAEQLGKVMNSVWVSASATPSWLAGGSYMVARRIRMTIETWDRTALSEQERIIGRTKGEGSPLSGGTEFTAPDFAVLGRADKPLIDADSHVRLAHPESNAGTEILRRGYNFVDGNDSLGRLEAGLFFISYQRSPAQFIDIQMNLAKNDLMNEYIRHVGSGLFAVPAGAKQGSYVGAALFV
ncbi:deferrochelatase/peroxidase EfeB [Agreia pratensis]|uniref:iron uptake transporter deferrochelatase/peroxidase subunit n=1 Tax=Agreia pratensis TaxID=150121 RepID=UPI00188D9601|nr:iron uptake transporter deferrochelatase/peroxidase subunit [Agreia pratensis]MBF4634557.1 deferrochelatase/peroxidase EfeB [Agreia pratensis]